MKKNKKILILIIIIILLIAGIAILIINNRKKEEEEERINRTTTTNISNEEEKEGIIEKLEAGGLQVEKGDSIYSETLKENGNIYIINGLNIEIYNVNEAKVLELSNNQVNSTILIEGENGIKENAVILQDKIILNCDNEQMQQKLIDIFTN